MDYICHYYEYSEGLFRDQSIGLGMYVVDGRRVALDKVQLWEE